ncbi:MAG: protein kinase [Acinetobacter sp.]
MSLKPIKNKMIESKGAGWILIEQINSGGNGLIWTAYEQSTPSNICVFKFLPRTSRKIEFSRLKREFEVHTALYRDQEKYNVLPIFDYSLNDNDYSWVRLPLAKTFDQGIAETAFLQKIQLLIKLCNDIQTLHADGYCHRDIKPNNLLFLNNILYLADFGLVTDPLEETGITPSGTRMGNYQTIAPEMRKINKDLQTEDYKTSDIYSLGVTIWMILCEDKHGFDGEYSTSQREKLEQILLKEKIVLTNIHTIIEGCTKTNPEERITLDEITSILTVAESSLKNYSEYINSKWEDVCKKLNPYEASKIELTDIKTIYNFLNTFYSYEPDLHHAFFPNTGGLDIRGLELNEKDEFIILNLGSFKTWLKPKRLVYRHFDTDIANNYIYLESVEIPCFSDYHSSETIEYTLLNDRFLSDLKHWNSNLFEERNIQKIASRITIVHSGSFLFAKNFSAYERSSGAYDALHSKQFKNFESFDEYFCKHYTSNSSELHEITLPFEFKIEQKNISSKVPFNFLEENDIQTIFYKFKSIEYSKTQNQFKNLILHTQRAIKVKEIFEEYSLDKIKELWGLYNLGKQLHSSEINEDYYNEFYMNCIDDDDKPLSEHDYNSLSLKINGIIKGTLIRFINQALRSLKHTNFLIDEA